MRRRLPSTQARRLAMALPALAACVVVFGGANVAAGATRRGVCRIAIADDAFSTPQDTALTVDDPGVVSNDTLCGSDGLVISITQPSHGDLADFDDSGGGFTYTPDAGFVGTDTFTYTLEDVETDLVGTVTLTVTGSTTTTTGSTTTTTEATTTTTGSTTTTTAATTTTTSGGVLPVTGSNVGGVAVFGFALVAGGLGLAGLARRRSAA